MRLWQTALLLTLTILPASGCGVFRSIEQWKCDNMGLCWFGLRPSNTMHYGPPPAEFAAPGQQEFPVEMPQQQGGF